MKNKYNKIYNLIKKYNTIYIVRHIGPDPDAIASQTALKMSILETFPEKKVYALGNGVAKFKYFGKLDKVSEFEYEDSLVISLDVPDIKRVDGLDLRKFKNKVKIDHHPIVDEYGIVEVINPNASSASEILLDIINSTKLKCNKNIAENLFIGIVSDSNRFLYGNTSAKSFELIGNLIKNYDLEITTLYNKLYARPLNEVRLMGYIELNLIVNDNFGYIILDETVYNEYGVDSSSSANMINNLNNINEVKIWLFVSYDKNNDLYKANIRSREIVINEIAQKYNGGGHKFASGVRTHDKEDIDNLIKDLQELAKKQKN